jgi:hypothetical protein
MEVSKSLQADIIKIQNELKAAIQSHQASTNFSIFWVTLNTFSQVISTGALVNSP